MRLYYELTIYLMVFTVCYATDPIVDTPLGKVRGYRMTTRGGREFLAFSGLPYAKPPIGNLRFEPPQTLKRWKGVKEAKEDGPYCTQYNMLSPKPIAMGVEDCLYLSLYTHRLSGNAPVLVHFHGGGFVLGNGAKITKPQYLMDEDNIIIVDINYRLDMFGFLSFEDSVMPGNQGLKDQVMALQWIKKNIRSFGGNPNRVTLIGESAGGASVYHHTVSPLSRGLFHGGILQSGTSYNPWALLAPGMARNGSIWLLTLLGCNYTSTKAALSCLRSKDAYEIVSKYEYFKGWQMDMKFAFGPVLEPAGPGAFLKGPISKWKHNPVPLIMGMTSAEGLLRTLYMHYVNTSYPWFYENFEELAPLSLYLQSRSSNPSKVVKAVRDYYFPNKKITQNDWVNLTTMYTDSWFTVGIIDGANKHKGDVYFYYFDYIGKNSLARGIGDTRNNSLMFGPFHNDEIIYLWNNKDYANLKEKDLDISRKLVKMWVDFAKNGYPSSTKNFKWRKWSSRSHSYMDISKNGFIMKDGLARDRYRFWKTLNYRDNYDKLYRRS